MAFKRDLELDDVRDPDIRAAYEEKRLVFRQGMGAINCPHCKRGVGLLLPGNALGRTGASRTLLVVHPPESLGDAIKRGTVVVVEGEVRQKSSAAVRAAEATGTALVSALQEMSVDEISDLLDKVRGEGGVE